MTRIDAHQHFWHYSAVDYPWISDGMKGLRADFLPRDLEVEQSRCRLHGSVAVQARQSIVETEWLLSLADNHPWIIGVVGWVDLRSPDAAGLLDRFATHPALCGVRHVVQDESDDRFMLLPDFQGGIELLARRNLTYDILIFPHHLPVAFELAARFPEQKFVLDHLAKPLIADRRIEPWASEIQKLAALPNVACKVSGLVTEARWGNWAPDDIRPYLEIAAEAFGSRRLLFGSDWPVCTLAATYCQVVELVDKFLQQLPEDERSLVWGGNLALWYPKTSMKICVR